MNKHKVTAVCLFSLGVCVSFNLLKHAYYSIACSHTNTDPIWTSRDRSEPSLDSICFTLELKRKSKIFSSLKRLAFWLESIVRKI